MTFRFSTTHSRETLDRLTGVMPGGNTRSGVYFPPFPLVLSRGAGFRVWDVDGNDYIDYLNNFTSLVHGHAHPRIVEALERQIGQGTVFSAPTEAQAELAERICRRIPSVEQLRFTNSGSEANIMAVRVARAFTGRDHIVMASGGYHGLWEQVDGGTQSGVQQARSGAQQSGIPAAVHELAHHVPFNDVEALEAVMQREGERIACLIFEPVRGTGVLPATPEYLHAARRLADRYGALLILDEVVTARLHENGYGAMVGVNADLTTLGKIIGGGLPVGAVGGRADVMALFDPRRPDALAHSGTYNGNELTMVAGCASLDLLPQREIDRINALGDLLRGQLGELFTESGMGLKAGGYGSLVSIVPAAGDGSALALADFHLAALEEGIYFAARGMLNLSTPMDEMVVEESVQRLERAARRVAEGENGSATTGIPTRKRAGTPAGSSRRESP